MNDFTFQNTTKVYFGKNQLENLHKEVLKYGNKVLLAYGGGSIKKMGLYDKVINELQSNGIEVFELSGVEPNPRHTTVNKGATICKENNIPVLLAVGGGSTIDCCKAIAATACSDTDNVWNLISRKVAWQDALPIIAMPTMAIAIPITYMPYVIISAFANPNAVTSPPAIAVKIGSFAPQEKKGMTRTVAILSFSSASVRVLIIAGTEQPKPIIIGMNDFP